MEKNEIIKFYLDEGLNRIEFKAIYHDLDFNLKLQLIARLEESKQDLLNSLYDAV